MNKILEKISELGIIPIVKIKKALHTLPLGRALIDSSLSITEIIFRISSTEKSIKILAKKLSELLIGTGIVLTIKTSKKTISVENKFIVSLSFIPKVVDCCIGKKYSCNFEHQRPNPN